MRISKMGSPCDTLGSAVGQKANSWQMRLDRDATSGSTVDSYLAHSADWRIAGLARSKPL